MNKIIRTAIVDDDKLFTELLSRLIDECEDMEVVYTTHTGEAFIANYEEKAIDVLLLDLQMDDGIGLSVLRELQIRSETIKTIALSAFYKSSFMTQILKLGASAFLPKDINEIKLVQLIQTVYKKGHYFSKDQLEIMRLQLSKKLPEFTDHSKEKLRT